jgi:micrococcal nuclease
MMRLIAFLFLSSIAVGADPWSGSTLYNYRAKVTRVVDGDTIDAEIDLGFEVQTKKRLRLLWINAPEAKGATKQAGDKARDHLWELLMQADDDEGWFEIHTEKADSFGRYLVLIRFGETTVNQRMIDDGHAVEFRRDK